MGLDEWQFTLPPELLARFPVERRDRSRLLHLDSRGQSHHLRFDALPELLQPGDLLVVNDTRVVPARLHARRSTGGRVELLVLDPTRTSGPLEALAKPARKLRDGEELALEGGGHCRILGRGPDGVVHVDLGEDPLSVLEAAGELPLPPYLERTEQPVDRERYQTIYARDPGAVAAPTAGLHFTEELRTRLLQRGVGWAAVTLHVGLGTFRPLREEDVARGALHEERFRVPKETEAAIRACRDGGGAVIAVGTTSARALESATSAEQRIPTAGEAVTDLLIAPGYRWRCVDRLITNFHLPGSSLLLLVASLASRENLLSTYAEAIERRYRFYSYGDAMLVDRGSDPG